MDFHSEGLNGVAVRNKGAKFKAQVNGSCSLPLERLHPQMEPVLELGMVHINFFPKKLKFSSVFMLFWFVDFCIDPKS